MKRNIITNFDEVLLLWIPIVLGEFIFHKVYLDPVASINLVIISIPIYNISLSFLLKFAVFDVSLWFIGKKLFITREYYGFPYPELLCPIFAIFTVSHIVLVTVSFLYALLYSFKYNHILLVAQAVFSAIVSFQKNPLGSMLNLFTFDYSVFLPVIVVIINFCFLSGLGFFFNKKEKSQNETDETNEIFWQRDLIMPGEEGYRSQYYYSHRLEGVYICFLVLYRFIVLMNLHLSYWEIIGILLALMVFFYSIEHYNYSKKIGADRHYLYEKIAGELHFQDGMNWKDLVDFQILEIQRLKEIENKFNSGRIRNIRWLELYEHRVINDAKSIYDAILNWEDGIYDIQKTMQVIKTSISSIDKISTECIPILPNSRKFNPTEIDFIDLIDYFQTKIPLVGGEFRDETLIDLYKNNTESLDIDKISTESFFIDFSDLESVLHILGAYLLQISDKSFVCRTQIDNAGWLNIELKSPVLDSSKIHIVQRDIKGINKLWDESQGIDYYNFPIELAVAQAYMKDNDGDMAIKIEDNKLIFSIVFSTKSNLEGHINQGKKNNVINIGKFLEEYTAGNKSYTSFYCLKDLYINIKGNSMILKEVLSHFADYSRNRIKEKNSILVNIEETESLICISLKFLCHFHFYPIKWEVQDTLQYWRNSKQLVPEHSSLALLMMKIKVEELTGSVDLVLEDEYFLCKLIFTKYKPK